MEKKKEGRKRSNIVINFSQVLTATIKIDTDIITHTEY